jgi:hypothetical protein
VAGKKKFIFLIRLFLLCQLLGLSLNIAGSVCHHIELFADERISVGKDTPSMGNILLNSSVTDQGKKAKAVTHH